MRPDDAPRGHPGCGACHLLSDAGGAGQVGPPLDGIGEVAGTRINGISAADYLEASILNPDEFVVPGYPAGVMPLDYGAKMTPAEVQVMVDYLLSQ